MSRAVVFDGNGAITKIREQVTRPDARVYFGDTHVVRAASLSLDELAVCQKLEKLTRDPTAEDPFDGCQYLPQLQVATNGPALFIHMPVFSTVTVQSEIERGRHLDVDLCLQVARAIAFLHQHNIVHGDIAPANVLVRKSANGSRVQVIDFGSSRIYTDDAPFHPLPIQRVTATTRDAFGRFMGRTFPVSDVVAVVLLSLMMRGMPRIMARSDQDGPDGLRHAINVSLFGPLGNGWGLHRNCPYCPCHPRRSVALDVLLDKYQLPKTWSKFNWTDPSITARVLCEETIDGAR